MKLTQFLQQITASSDFFTQHTSIVLQYEKSHPILFMSRFLESLKKQNIPLESLDVSTVDSARIAAQLQTSFLGQRFIYFVRGYESLDKKKQQELLTYFSTYTGPHTVLWVASTVQLKKVPEGCKAIVLPEVVDLTLFTQLLTFFTSKCSPNQKKLAQRICKKHEKLSLDSASLLCSYSQVVGADHDAFCDNWLDAIVGVDSSLFTLSQHFFSKDAKAFLSYWKQIKDNYQFPFWISFWSEQLWRAYFVVHYSKANQFGMAKKMSYRLPFSLVQRDWRKLKTNELRAAHAFIYQIDYRFKHGGSQSLDLFYTQFFTNQFA